MYLTKKQINFFINKLGQPYASIYLRKFYNSYRSILTSQDVAELYNSEYENRLAEHEHYTLIDGRYRINQFNKFSYEYLISRSLSNSRILDIGCGNGDFALAVATSSNVKQVIGVDISETAILSAQSKAKGTKLPVRFILSDINDFSSSVDFDFIILNDVLEHLSDSEIGKTLEKAKHWLKSSGKLIAHTPNGLALCNDTDSTFLQKIYKNYLKMVFGWEGLERSADQIYYEQVHINIKSFRQFRSLLLHHGFFSKVIYDEKNKRLGSLLDKITSTNMLLIAAPNLFKYL